MKKAIKHKNRLYYKKVRLKTAYNELTYTTYRNKLKNILFKAEKDYYAKLLETNKSNMKKTWSILKEVINKKKCSKSETKFKLDNETFTTNKQLISEKFNDFFTNIGPNLASKIPNQSVAPEDFLGDQILNSILLESVTIKELDEIIL